MGHTARWYAHHYLTVLALSAGASSTGLLFLQIGAAVLPEGPATLIEVAGAFTVHLGDSSAQVRGQVRATPPGAECLRLDGDGSRPEQQYLYIFATGEVLAVEYLADHVTSAGWLVNGVDVEPAMLQCADS
jgi:hypothetical protein